MKLSKTLRIYFPSEGKPAATPRVMDSHEKPKFLSRTHSPYPFAKHDKEFGFEPSHIAARNLPHVVRSLGVKHALKEPTVQIGDSMKLHSCTDMATDVHHEPEKTGSLGQSQERNKDAVKEGTSAKHSRSRIRNFPIHDEIDERCSRIQSMSSHRQVVRYKSALSPCNILREWQNCMNFGFQNTQSIFTRADILSKLDDFSNQEIGQVLHMMTLRHEGGTPFHTKKHQSRPITQNYNLTVPDAAMHQAHFSFLAGIEDYFVNKGIDRIKNDPQFLATVLRVFAHLRSDDSTSDFERFAQTHSSTYNLHSRAFMRTDTFMNWHKPCGEQLFHTAQMIVCDDVDRFELPQLAEILGASVVMRQWANAAMFNAIEDRALRAINACHIPEKLELGARKKLQDLVKDASQIYLFLSLAGVWNEHFAHSVVHLALAAFGSKPSRRLDSPKTETLRTSFPLNDRLPHVRTKVSVLRPPSDIFLAIASSYPLQAELFVEVWKSVPEDCRVISDYKYLHDMLLRESRQNLREYIIRETIGSLEDLDRILIQGLPFFGRDFSLDGIHGFTNSQTTNIIKRAANSVRILDASCLHPRCDKQFITHEMDLQATGGKIIALCYSSLRFIDERSQRCMKPKTNIKWTLDIIKEEIRKGSIQLILPSDEITLCRKSYGNDTMMPIFAVRHMTEMMPLVEPVIVSRHKSHHMQDAFPIFTENGRYFPGTDGQGEIQSTFFNEHILTKRIIKFEKPKGATYCKTLGHYDDFVDEKLRGVLHNERQTYKRSYNLDYKEIVTERPGFHSFLHDVRKAGYAPKD